jgi:hypothetical protein
MTTSLIALDPLTALHLEVGRTVSAQELLEWFVDDGGERAARCAEVLARCNIDHLIASLEGTLMEKLEVQSAVYERLERMLAEEDSRPVALEILHRSTSVSAHDVLRNDRRGAARTREIA